MSRRREIAKFVAGAEAFHALVHGVLWATDTRLRLFGFEESRGYHAAGAVLNGVASIVAGVYAWEVVTRASGHATRRTREAPSPRTAEGIRASA